MPARRADTKTLSRVIRCCSKARPATLYWVLKLNPVFKETELDFEF